MKLRITPGAILLLAVLARNGGTAFYATVLCVAVHEAGHLLAAWLLRVRISVLELDLPGARLQCAGALPSYRAEALLAAGGPLASLLPFLITLPLQAPFAALVRSTTLSLALFNLLPVAGFDGGRILFCAMAALGGERVARGVLNVSTYLALLLLFALSSCLLLRYGENLTLAVLCASLFARLFLPNATSGESGRKKRGFQRI